VILVSETSTRTHYGLAADESYCKTGATSAPSRFFRRLITRADPGTESGAKTTNRTHYATADVAVGLSVCRALPHGSCRPSDHLQFIVATAANESSAVGCRDASLAVGGSGPWSSKFPGPLPIRTSIIMLRVHG